MLQRLNWTIILQNGCSLLHCAVYGGNIDLVDWLSETFDLDVHQRTKVVLD